MQVYFIQVFLEFPLILKSFDFWRLKSRAIKSPEIVWSWKSADIWSQRSWKSVGL